MSIIAQMSQRIQELERENEKLLRTMRLHAGDCCSLNNEVELFRGHWEEEEKENKRLNKIIADIEDWGVVSFDEPLLKLITALKAGEGRRGTKKGVKMSNYEETNYYEEGLIDKIQELERENKQLKEKVRQLEWKVKHPWSLGKDNR